MRLRSFFLPLAACASLLAFTAIARADPAPECASSSSVGTSCTTAGTAKNQPGICESTPCSSLDGGASAADGGTCFACLVDGTAGTCGGGRTRESPSAAASFAPTVGGCCNVAGTTPWGSGAGLFVAVGLVGLGFFQRRRRA
jgi:MYXO-CTERM domain-containing protein